MSVSLQCCVVQISMWEQCNIVFSLKFDFHWLMFHCILFWNTVLYSLQMRHVIYPSGNNKNIDTILEKSVFFSCKMPERFHLEQSITCLRVGGGGDVCMAPAAVWDTGRGAGSDSTPLWEFGPPQLNPHSSLVCRPLFRMLLTQPCWVVLTLPETSHCANSNTQVWLLCGTLNTREAETSSMRLKSFFFLPVSFYTRSQSKGRRQIRSCIKCVEAVSQSHLIAVAHQIFDRTLALKQLIIVKFYRPGFLVAVNRLGLH